jgi:SAM-dependent methyltransferase
MTTVNSAWRTADGSGRLWPGMRPSFCIVPSVLGCPRAGRRAGGRWCTSRRGRRILGDDLVRATYEAFSIFHTALYRDLEHQLTTGEDRRDIYVDGELIARLSRFMDEFVRSELHRLVAEDPPGRILDVGCGAAAHLCHLLHAVPDARAVGVEPDPAAAALARTAVARERLAHRAEIVELKATSFLDQRSVASFDLVLLANMVYYVPASDRVGLLRALADRLQPGGRLLIVSTAPTNDQFSRHFDLLLRAQAGALELPDFDLLREQLTKAGLTPEQPRRIAPGEPLTAIVGALGLASLIPDTDGSNRCLRGRVTPPRHSAAGGPPCSP